MPGLFEIRDAWRHRMSSGDVFDQTAIKLQR